MNKIQYLTGTITYAIRGRDLLRMNGFKAHIERTPNNLDRVGCGYSIIAEGEQEKVEKIFDEAEIKILGKINLN